MCRDRIVVSTLRCVRNNPGSNPGFGKYFILYSVMPLINLHKSRIMRPAEGNIILLLRFASWHPGDFILSQVRTSH